MGGPAVPSVESVDERERRAEQHGDADPPPLSAARAIAVILIDAGADLTIQDGNGDCAADVMGLGGNKSKLGGGSLASNGRPAACSLLEPPQKVCGLGRACCPLLGTMS